MRHPIYTRTQSLWLVWVVLPAPLSGTAASLLAQGGTRAAVGLTLLALGAALLLMLTSTFTVEVGEGEVEWRFGMLGWPRWRVALHEIASVEVTKTTFWEGWGIRKTRSGWLYNASGEQALRLTLQGGRTLRLGSDEPERLASFIRSRMTPPGKARSGVR